MKLTFKSVIQVIECLKCSGITGFTPTSFPLSGSTPLYQGQFKEFRHIQITRQNIGFFSKRTGFDTPAASAFPGIFDTFADSCLLHHHRIGVKNRWVSKPLADNAAGFMEKTIRCFFTDLHIALGLQQMEFFDHLQNNI